MLILLISMIIGCGEKSDDTASDTTPVEQEE